MATTLIGKPKREWTPGPVILSRPIYSIGRFFMDLPKDRMLAAIALAKKAHTMPKQELERAVKQLEHDAKDENARRLNEANNEERDSTVEKASVANDTGNHSITPQTGHAGVKGN
jgi:hypothetical protein